MWPEADWERVGKKCLHANIFDTQRKNGTWPFRAATLWNALENRTGRKDQRENPPKSQNTCAAHTSEGKVILQDCHAAGHLTEEKYPVTQQATRESNAYMNIMQPQHWVNKGKEGATDHPDNDHITCAPTYSKPFNHYNYRTEVHVCSKATAFAHTGGWTCSNRFVSCFEKMLEVRVMPSGYLLIFEVCSEQKIVLVYVSPI